LLLRFLALSINAVWTLRVSMIAFALMMTAAFLAYANGANDNFKGVATLCGSGTCGYQIALTWATLTTFAGGVAAIFLAGSLAAKFTGSGLLPTSVQSTPHLLLAVAGGAGIAVFLASRFGLPASTTHALTGALTGAGLIAAAGAIHWSYLGMAFLLPLLFAPLFAAVLAAAFYRLAHTARLRISPDACVCVGWEEEIIAAQTRGGAPTARAERQLVIRAGQLEECAQSYSGRMLGLPVAPFIAALHFLSAGAVSFARGLNDTPKIAALLLILPELQPKWLMLFIGLGMTSGGLSSGNHVAETMSYRLTSMNGSQGLTSNLATALLVTTASLHGLPVSTTHVSVGTLLGIGTVTRQANWRKISKVLAAWVVILPASALFAALIYFCLRAA
jgi:inorganic phosphate transporter, PiT family